jgi:hypothetical protein
MSDLAANKAARECAEAVIQLIGDKQPVRMWEELARLVAEKLPPVPPPYDPLAPMDTQEAIRFEAHTITFGKYAGEQVGIVPPEYIGWLAENDFGIKLRRYVKSTRFKQREIEEFDE